MQSKGFALIFFVLIVKRIKQVTSINNSKKYKPILTPLIVNGFEISSGNFPYFTLIWVKTQTGLLQCGGALIDPNWVLSAAHCIPPNTVSVLMRIGQYYFNHSIPQNFDERVPSQILKHPNFNKNAIFNYDFSMLRIEEASQLPTVKLDNGTLGNRLKSGDPLLAMGLGTIDNEGSYEFPTSLMAANVHYVSNENCSKQWEGFADITEAMTCYNGNQSTCKGDSG